MPFRGNGRNPSEKSRTTELSVKLPLKELKGEEEEEPKETHPLNRREQIVLMPTRQRQ